MHFTQKKFIQLCYLSNFCNISDSNRESGGSGFDGAAFADTCCPADGSAFFIELFKFAILHEVISHDHCRKTEQS